MYSLRGLYQNESGMKRKERKTRAQLYRRIVWMDEWNERGWLSDSGMDRPGTLYFEAGDSKSDPDKVFAWRFCQHRWNSLRAIGDRDAG